MSLLITGGAGFIGSHLAERLNPALSTTKQNSEAERAGLKDVIIIDDFNDYYSPEIKRRNISKVLGKVIERDIRDNLDDIFKQNSISTVVHLAARAGVRPSIKDPILYNSVNVLGTINLLECCKRFNVKKFIFGSSSSVYGVTSRLPFSEDDPLENPISPYAVTKIAGEDLCRVYHGAYGISVTCLRFFTVYGPRQRPEMAIQKFISLIKEDKPIPYYGDGSTSRDYTYITDIIDGIMASLDKDLGFEIINLGDSKKVTLVELVGIIEDVLGKEAKLDIQPPQPGDVPITYADITKAERLLGYTPKVDIRDGIRRQVNARI